MLSRGMRQKPVRERLAVLLANTWPLFAIVCSWVTCATHSSPLLPLVRSRSYFKSDSLAVWHPGSNLASLLVNRQKPATFHIHYFFATAKGQRMSQLAKAWE
jgi:hypothetical protein